MAEGQAYKNIFQIGLGVDFYKKFVEGLLDCFELNCPEKLASATIYVNSNRAGRYLETLLRQNDIKLLPRILSLAELPDNPVLPVLSPQRKKTLSTRLELMQLVLKLLEKEPDIAPRSSAFDLASSLYKLMDEMHGEGVDFSTLSEIDLAEYSAHWKRSLQFINLLESFWENIGEVSIDGEARRRETVSRLEKFWEHTSIEHPIFIVGSTGSRDTTAWFMKLVSSQENGYVIVPGYDQDMPKHVWEKLSQHDVLQDHAQSRLLNLFERLEIDPDMVLPWGNGKDDSPRNKLISLSLRPAPITDEWLSEGPALLPKIDQATVGLSLIEAEQLSEEATAIAVVVRKAIHEAKTTALITPNRILARRVSAELNRWKITPDDSGGRPLSLAPSGLFLRLVLNGLRRPLDLAAFLSILKHPITHSGDNRGQHLLWVQDLEAYLRMRSSNIDWHLIEKWCQLKRDDEKRFVWVKWLKDIYEQFEQVLSKGFDALIATHLGLSERLSFGSMGSEAGRLWTDISGEVALKAVDDLKVAGVKFPTIDFEEYRQIFSGILQEYDVRETFTVHPDIVIYGTLEARVQHADIVILGGLNDGDWPNIPKPDPWLNRAMRKQIGLPSIERVISLSAHDFQLAITQPNVILTRSLRDGDAPTVTSRWLTRLTSLLEGIGDKGAASLQDMKDRGQVYLDVANQLHSPTNIIPLEKRPNPKPPVICRPKRLSVTRIETLIRDPYAIYARYILKLGVLRPLIETPNPMMRGTVIHSVFEKFGANSIDVNPDEFEEIFDDVASEILNEQVPWSYVRRLWWAKLKLARDWFLTQERAYRMEWQPYKQEVSGGYEFQLTDTSFILTAKMDRIDKDLHGRISIIDYKSGSAPSKKQQKHFNKQLQLEGLIAARSGVEGITNAKIAQLAYLGLTDKKLTQVEFEDPNFVTFEDELQELLNAYSNPEVGYPSRLRVEKMSFAGDYDHLSRLGEWNDTDQLDEGVDE